MGLLQLLHDLIVLGIHIIVVAIVDALRLFLALEDVEEGVARSRLNNNTLFSRLLVFLGLFDLLLRRVLALLPVNGAPDDINCLISVPVGDGGE